MTLDIHVAALIDGLAEQGFQSFEKIGLEASRAAIESFTGLQGTPPEVASVVPAQYGALDDQALRIYVPFGDGPFPVVVYVHGGGFIGGSLDVVDEPARALATDLGAVVVAVTYRKAPEHRFPAAHDDVAAALAWVADHVAEHGGDPARLAVAGDSAGGNLAAAAVLQARDAGAPAVRAQVLIYPLIDPVADTPSRTRFAEGYLIHLDALAWFGSQYVGSPADVTDPRLDVSRASLTGLPPTLVLTNEYDTLRDEAEAFGRALASAGVECELQRFDGLVHGVYWMSGVVPRCAEQRKAVVDFLTVRLS